MRKGGTIQLPPYPSVNSPETQAASGPEDSNDEANEDYLTVSGEWSSDIEEIELMKGSTGLSFGLYPCQVSVCFNCASFFQMFSL